MSYSEHTKKRVTFASECKTHDGFKTRHNFLYSVMCIAFFKGNLRTKEDILRSCEDDRDFIDFCLREAIIARGKLFELKEREKEYQAEYTRTFLSGNDPKWDTPFFMEMTRRKTRPGVPVIRVGCSNRMTNFKFHTEHLQQICDFINLLHIADEHLFKNTLY